MKKGSRKLCFSTVHGNISIADLSLSDFFLHLVFFYEEIAELKSAKVL